MTIFIISDIIPIEGVHKVNIYQKASLVLALLLYIPLSYQIVKGLVRQNLATFLLWGLLDAIAGVSLLVQNGNYQLPLAYVAGCTLVILSILKSKNFGGWASYETKVSLMVIACAVAWRISGPWLATIFSTAGVVIAGFPQLRDSWRDPASSPLLVYIGFTVVNVLSTVGGKAWTVEERLYSGACSVLCVAVVVASLRRTEQKESVSLSPQ